MNLSLYLSSHVWHSLVYSALRTNGRWGHPSKIGQDRDFPAESIEYLHFSNSNTKMRNAPCGHQFAYKIYSQNEMIQKSIKIGED